MRSGRIELPWFPAATSRLCVYRFRHERENDDGERDWIRTSAGLAPVRLRAACRRPLGYSSMVNREGLKPPMWPQGQPD